MAQQKAKTANHHTCMNDDTPGLQATHAKSSISCAENEQNNNQTTVPEWPRSHQIASGRKENN